MNEIKNKQELGKEEDTVHLYEEKMNSFSELLEKIKEGQKAFNKESILEIANLNDELLYLGDFYLYQLLSFYHGNGRGIIVWNGKTYTSYSELKAEYPNFNINFVEEMKKVLEDVEKRRDGCWELYKALEEQNESNMKDFFDELANNGNEENIRGIAAKAAKITEKDLEELKEYINVLFDDKIKIAEFINRLTQDDGQGEKRETEQKASFVEQIKVGPTDRICSDTRQTPIGTESPTDAKDER